MNEQGAPSPIPTSSFATPAFQLSFGQILDRTFQLTRTHWRLFFGIAGVPAAAIFLFAATMMSFMVRVIGPQLVGKRSVPPGFPPLFSAGVFIGELLLLMVYALYLPSAFHAAAQADLGDTVTFRQAYRVVWSRYGRYLWLMILYFLYLVVPVAVVAALIGGGTVLMHHGATNAGSQGFPLFLIPLLVLLYVCFLVYTVLIMLRFAVAYPASVEENLPAWAAFGRSARLTHGAKGRIFLVILVVYAAVYAAQLACMLILGVLAALVALGAMLAHVAVRSAAFYILVGLGVLGYLLVAVVTALLIYAALTTVLAVIYHDQRRRMDGLAVAHAQAG